MSLFCKKLESYLIFAKPCKLSFICRNIARYLVFAKVFSIIFFCKNLEIYLLFAKIFQDIFYLQDSLKEYIICRKLARCSLIPGILQHDSDLQGKSKLSNNCNKVAKSQNKYYLQDFCQLSIFCKNLASYLLPERILQDISFLLIYSKKFFSARISQVI